MARLENMPAQERDHLLSVPCPTFETSPFVQGPDLSKRRVALISTAGIHRRGDRPFDVGANDYRVIPRDTPARDVIMSHISTNFDRIGFQEDLNVIFPLERLKDLADEQSIGSLADIHYSFMGATDPLQMREKASELAGIMKGDTVDAVLLVPV